MCFRPPTVEMEKNFCPECGAEAMLGARKCRQCGAELSQSATATGTPEAHGAPQAPGAPKAPKVPGTPKAPGVPPTVSHVSQV